MNGGHQIFDPTSFETLMGGLLLASVLHPGILLHIWLVSPAVEELSLRLCHNLYHSKKKSRASSAFLGISYKELNSKSIVSKILGWKDHWIYQVPQAHRTV